MTVTHKSSAGTVGTGTSSATVGSMPTHATGDMLVASVSWGNDAGSEPTCSTAGWTRVGGDTATRPSPNNTYGIDSGSRGVVVFYKVATSAAETAPTFTQGGTASTATMGAWVSSFQKTLTSWVTPAGVSGKYQGDTTSYSAAFASDPGITAGDSLHVCLAAMPDSGTLSALALTIPGITGTTLTGRNNQAVTQGNDVRATTQGRDVAAGAGTATGVATHSFTNTVATTGVSFLVRLRDASVTSVNIGQVTETETPQATTRLKKLAAGQPSETDATSSPTGRHETKLVSQPSSASIAQPVTWKKSKAVGQVTETETSQVETRLKSKAVGQVTETETSQHPTFSRSTNVGQPSSASVAQPLTRSKSKAVGQATETDLAQKPVKRIPVGQAEDIEDLPAITSVRLRAVGQAVETDATIARNANFAPNPTIEDTVAPWTTDSTGFRTAALSVVQSTEQAHSGTHSIKATWPTTPDRGSGVTSGDWGVDDPDHPGFRMGDVGGFEIGRQYTLSAWVYVPSGSPDVRAAFRLKVGGAYSSVKDTWHQVSVTWVANTTRCGLAVETVEGSGLSGGTCYIDDWSLTTTGVVRSKGVGQPSTSQAAQTAGRRKAKNLQQTTEADSSRAVLSIAPHRVDIGVALEDDEVFPQDTTTEDANSVRVIKRRSVGQPSETDLSQPDTRRKFRAIGEPSTTSSAQSVTRKHVRTIGQVVDTETSQSVTRKHVRTIGQVVDTETSQPITRLGLHVLGQPVETEASRPVTKRHTRSIGQAVEAESSRTTSKRASRHVGLALETDSGLPLAPASDLTEIRQKVDGVMVLRHFHRKAPV